MDRARTNPSVVRFLALRTVSQNGQLAGTADFVTWWSRVDAADQIGVFAIVIGGLLFMLLACVAAGHVARTQLGKLGWGFAAIGGEWLATNVAWCFTRVVVIANPGRLDEVCRTAFLTDIRHTAPGTPGLETALVDIDQARAIYREFGFSSRTLLERRDTDSSGIVATIAGSVWVFATGFCRICAIIARIFHELAHTGFGAVHRRLICTIFGQTIRRPQRLAANLFLCLAVESRVVHPVVGQG